VDVEALLAALGHVGEGPAARLRAGELLLTDSRLLGDAQLDMALADPAAGALRPTSWTRLAVALAVARSSGTRRLARAAGLRRAPRPALRARHGALAALDALGAGRWWPRWRGWPRVTGATPHAAGRSGGARCRRPAGRPGRAGAGRPSTRSSACRASSSRGRRAVGRPVRFRRGIAALLTSHGDAPYARWDARAARAERAGDELSLQAIGERYPNALAVEAAPAPLKPLTEGRARDVLAELSQPPWAATARTTTARAPPTRKPRWRPRCAAPGRSCRRAARARRGRAPVRNRRVKLGASCSRASPGASRQDTRAACWLGGRRRQIHPLDATGGPLGARLPAAHASLITCSCSPRATGCWARSTRPAARPTPHDQLYAWSMEDGAAWGAGARQPETVLADGLLLALDALGRQGAPTTSWATARAGLHGTAARLPPCNQAHLLLTGGRCSTHDQGETRDGVAFDVRRGPWTRRAGGCWAAGAARAGPKLLMALDDAPIMLCSIKGDDDDASSLLGWDASEQHELWRARAGSWITRQSLYPRAGACCSGGRAAGDTTRRCGWCRWTRAGRCRHLTPNREGGGRAGPRPCAAPRGAPAMPRACRGRRPTSERLYDPAARAGRTGTARRAGARRLRPGAGCRRPGATVWSACSIAAPGEATVESSRCPARRSRSRWLSAKERS
jgi:hypothetical protein